jgi:hypothetical protein
MRHTFLRGESKVAEVDSFLAVAIETTMEDYDLILLKRVDQKGRYEVTVIIESPHLREITQILALTDFYCRLSFVSMSLDGWIKIWDEEGNQDHDGVQASGQVLNGSVIPSRAEHFVVSIQNEETEENQVCVYRRLALKKPLNIQSSL